MDDWLPRFYRPVTNSIDEDAAYDLAGYASMRRRVVHGPHVADVAAGPLRWRQTIYTDRDTPLGCDPVAFGRIDAAADRTMTDIAWVQLPRGGLQDSSGGWLDSHILDGLRYVLWCRAANTAKTVICVSYGSTIGPHDGSSILAEALDAIVTAETATAATADALHVVIAAGSLPRRWTRPLDARLEHSGDIVWRVPPGSEYSRLPADLAARQRVVRDAHVAGRSVHGPMAAGTVLFAPASGVPNAAVIYLASSSRGAGAMALVALGPTALEKRQRPRACATRRLETDAGGGRERGHGPRLHRAQRPRSQRRAARSAVDFHRPPRQPGPGVARAVRRPGTQPRRHAALRQLPPRCHLAPTRHHERHRLRPEAEGRRRALPQLFRPQRRPHPRVVFLGRPRSERCRTNAVHVISDRRVRSPARGPAAGSRSGSVYRLVGTSTAAPQLARWLLSKGPASRPDQGGSSGPGALWR